MNRFMSKPLDYLALFVFLLTFSSSSVLSPSALYGQPEAAVSQESLKELGAVVQQYVDRELTVGAELLVIQDDKVLFHQSYGMSDLKAKKAWENDTLCNIRSMTKPITSAAAQILIDQGRLKLDEPVATYLESFDNEKSRAITVRQVLTHRSGLPLTVHLHPYQYKSLDEQVAAAAEAGPEFEPGSKFWYSDIGTDVVGRLVEKISGESLHEFVQAQILKPLGMSDTFYGFNREDERLGQAATPYLNGPYGWRAYWKPGLRPLYPYAWGSQTLFSTTSDYAKFMKMMANQGRLEDRQVLSETAVQRMLEPVSRTTGMGTDARMPTGFHGLESWYGQMMMTYRPFDDQNARPVAISHSGSDGTIAWSWPDRDLTILYFTQSRGGFTPLRIEEAIDRLVFNPGMDNSESAPEELQPYLGTYLANFGDFENEEFVVRFRNGKLVLDIPSQLAFELNEPDENGYWGFALAPEQIRITFARNENDEVTGLTMHRGKRSFPAPRKD